MLKFLFVICCAVAYVATSPIGISGPITLNDRPVIETTGGPVEGVMASAGLFSRYYAFYGIPYAQAPVGNLRFRAPVPHGGWEGVWDASEHGNECPSGSFLADYSGDEDCLFLNVYSPNLIGRRPVMVWIHGGSFSSGSGNSFVYGPDHLIGGDVVVVTINYRLGALGFLSTGDRHAPGNYGMKDMLVALQWVKDNIIRFGGDPDNVTIFGESAGGVAVHYLLLSPMSEGLFHKAISQSGSALVPWGFQDNPLSMAHHAAEVLGITFTDTEDLVNQLRDVPAEQMVGVNPGWLDFEIPRGFSPMPFVPCVDAPDSEETIFLPATPREIMEAGTFQHMPYLTGYNDAESLFIIHEQMLDNSTLDTLNENPHFMIPREWNVDIPSPAADAIAQEFRDFYLNGEDISEDTRWEWSKYATDHHFVYGIDQTVRLHKASQADPIYYYVFSFVGDLNLIKRFLLLGSWPGAVHADDIPYIFSVTSLPPPLFPSNPALLTRRRLISMWTNFARTGNPTPMTTGDVPVIWPAVGNEQEYLDIGDSLVPGTHAMGDRMALWNRLRDTYAN